MKLIPRLLCQKTSILLNEDIFSLRGKNAFTLYVVALMLTWQHFVYTIVMIQGVLRSKIVEWNIRTRNASNKCFYSISVPVLFVFCPTRKRYRCVSHSTNWILGSSYELERTKTTHAWLAQSLRHYWIQFLLDFPLLAFTSSFCDVYATHHCI